MGSRIAAKVLVIKRLRPQFVNTVRSILHNLAKLHGDQPMSVSLSKGQKVSLEKPGGGGIAKLHMG